MFRSRRCVEAVVSPIVKPKTEKRQTKIGMNQSSNRFIRISVLSHNAVRLPVFIITSNAPPISRIKAAKEAVLDSVAASKILLKTEYGATGVAVTS